MGKNLHEKKLFFILGLFYVFNTPFAVILDDFTNLSLSPDLQINDNFLGEGISVQRTIWNGSQVTLSPHNFNFHGNNFENVIYKLSNDINIFSNPLSQIKINFSNPLPSNLKISIVLFSPFVTGSNEDPIKRIVNYFNAGDVSVFINENSPFAETLTNGNFDILKVDKILLNFSSTSSPLTFDISSIEIVPEPFSMIILGTGLFVFTRSKRKKCKYALASNK